MISTKIYPLYGTMSLIHVNRCTEIYKDILSSPCHLYKEREREGKREGERRERGKGDNNERDGSDKFIHMQFMHFPQSSCLLQA
jgi:hypothetical protein